MAASNSARCVIAALHAHCLDAHRFDAHRLDTEVREVTGVAIGGVAPLGLAHDLKVLMDEHLLGLDIVWAAAGTPNSVVPVAPDVLRRISAADVVRVVHAA